MMTSYMFGRIDERDELTRETTERAEAQFIDSTGLGKIVLY